MAMGGEHLPQHPYGYLGGSCGHWNHLQLLGVGVHGDQECLSLKWPDKVPMQAGPWGRDVLPSVDWGPGRGRSCLLAGLTAPQSLDPALVTTCSF